MIDKTTNLAESAAVLFEMVISLAFPKGCSAIKMENNRGAVEVLRTDRNHRPHCNHHYPYADRS